MPLGQRTILWVCSVFVANKWLRQCLLFLTAWIKPKSLFLIKSAAMKSLLTICHLLDFPRIFWMISMWPSDAYPYHAGDAYKMRDNIIAWNTFTNKHKIQTAGLSAGLGGDWSLACEGGCFLAGLQDLLQKNLSACHPSRELLLLLFLLLFSFAVYVPLLLMPYWSMFYC